MMGALGRALEARRIPAAGDRQVAETIDEIETDIYIRMLLKSRTQPSTRPPSG